MKVIESEILIPCDIDGTLLLWGITSGETVLFYDPYECVHKRVGINESNLRIAKNWLSRGATLQVWSRSGYKWAQNALKAIGLEHHNILISSKPLAYIDDQACDTWMGERVNLQPTDFWGRK